MISGRLDYGFPTSPSVMTHIESGKLRGLAVPTLQRSRLLPNIPTVAETGLPGFNVPSWYAVVAPRGTPEPVARLLAQKLNEVLADPTIRKRAFDAGALVAPSTPEALAARMERETAAWAEVVRAAKITAG